MPRRRRSPWQNASSLAEVVHPSIVKIFNFVEHPDKNGEPVGYIVMEYVGGKSLKPIAGKRLPVSEAIGYMLEILPALGYLHSVGLCYNDLKPEKHHGDRRAAQADRPRCGLPDRIVRIPLRHTGLPGTEIVRTWPHRRQRHLHGGTHACRTHAQPAHPQRPLRRRTSDDDPVLKTYDSFGRLLRRDRP